MARRVNISTARKELPRLFDRVTARDGEKVVIRRRDGGKEVVLASLDYVERLEAAAREVVAASPFRLFGSGTLHAAVEETLASIRAEDAEQLAGRLAEIATPTRPSDR